MPAIVGVGLVSWGEAGRKPLEVGSVGAASLAEPCRAERRWQWIAGGAQEARHTIAYHSSIPLQLMGKNTNVHVG